MRRQGDVRAAQFFCTAFVCRAIAMFTFTAADPAAFPAGDAGVLFLPFALIGTAAYLPLLNAAYKGAERGIFALTDSLSPAVTKAAALLYAAGAVWSAAIGAVRLELFMGTAMYTGARLTGLTVLLLAAAAVIACGGLETTVRTGTAVLALLAAALLFVGITTAGRFDAANLEPPLLYGWHKPLLNGLAAAVRTPEPAALAVLAPRVRGRLKRGAFIWFLCFGAAASALYTLILGVTGAYGERQMFRFYALAQLAEAGVLERADALICAVWVLCSLVRLSLHLLAAARFLEGGFAVKRTPVLAAGAAAAVFAVYLPLSGSAAAFAAVTGSGADVLLFLLAATALPLLLSAAVRVRRKRGLRA